MDEAFWGARAASIDALERELARLRRAAVAHARERGQALEHVANDAADPTRSAFLLVGREIGLGASQEATG